jgi:hypothetical protein
VARITFQKRQKEMKRKEKRQLKTENRAQRKIAKNAEFGASVAPMHKYGEANNVEKQLQAHGRETAIERWTETEGQRDGKLKLSS